MGEFRTVLTVIGSIILASGALFGIWLGAYYASGRLSAQMDEQARWFQTRREEEEKRFEKQLDAEAKRLERQLAHDRRMRDRDELRTVLDDVAGSLARCMSTALGVRQVVPVLGGRSEGYKESEDEVDNRLTLGFKAAERAYELLFDVQRLRLRFGLSHPVVTSFNALVVAINEFVEEVVVDEDKWTIDQRTLLDTKEESLGTLNAAFIDACREYTDVEIS